MNYQPAGLKEMENRLHVENNVNYNKIQYYCQDSESNRKELFKEALFYARKGKVLYILHEEFQELPELTQGLASINTHYMKMISFLYVDSLVSLVETLSSLPEWQNVPSTIILESLNQYCPKDKIQNACGIIALVIDTVRRCSATLGLPCKLLLSLNIDTGPEYHTLLKELYTVI